MRPTPTFYLAGAILAEVAGTTALKFTDGFTEPVPVLVVAGGYLASFYLLSLALETFPIGLVYAVWSGVGILAIAAIGVVFFEETVDAPAAVGMLLIVAGIVVLNVYSNAYGAH